MDESFSFYHIAKNVESEQTLLNNFSGGLRPIGEDTADASQKQASGLYFWGEKTSASRHVKYLTGGIEGGRENEVSDKVGEIEFQIPPEKLTFPEFRIDIERNEIRAKVVEAPMSQYLSTLNHPDSIKELSDKVELQEGEKLLGYSMQKMKYVEKNPNSKLGNCLCLNVLKDGQPVVRRAGVQDVEETAVWLSAKEKGFRDAYSNNLRDILKNSDKMSQEGLAFKYCGKESLPISKINLHENNNGVYEQKTIFDKGASEKIAKLRERMSKSEAKMPQKSTQDFSKIDMSTLKMYQAIKQNG